uniref:Uncharacterized protein n=1 Tax=Craspedostauros australis TaxID=1486917 RepID=A0A7R9WSV2_9STRA|mmetsp:Transcript_18459/g.51304  ORF Transcript_18459/g.51304 Transcript_18459/m.51304 type:complete len:280 (+) Transcript_18459:69-908(+)
MIILSALPLFTLTMLSVSEFAAKPFVQRAIKTPSKLESVLSFFFGVDFEDKDLYAKDMREGVPQRTMEKLWYMGGAEYDDLCKQFIPTIRQASNANSEMITSDPRWQITVDGKVGQLLLFDQLARNAFRGQDEAFAYDDLSEKLALQVLQNQLKEIAHSNDAPPAEELEGEMYPPYVIMSIMPLMHSESATSHEYGNAVLDWCIQQKYGSSELFEKQFAMTKDFMIDHTKVIDRFGRYPHRNDKLKRDSTQDEIDWLNDTDNLPMWAKSQGLPAKPQLE